ncbi:MAG: hypothetical protein H7840_08460 [Alphaproteobacteria bacterium]
MNAITRLALALALMTGVAIGTAHAEIEVSKAAIDKPRYTPTARKPAPKAKEPTRAERPIPDRGPAHFIVLIDDSGDMKDYRNRIAWALPRALFEWNKTDDKFPVFIPEKDHLSLTFYGLSTDDKGNKTCKERSDHRMIPGDLFDWLSPPPLRTASDLEEFLKEQLGLDCRFKEGLSPIAMAEVMALSSAPSVTNSFRKVYIVNVTNDLFNAQPSRDASNFARRFKLSGLTSAQELLSRTTRDFTFITNEHLQLKIPHGRSELAQGEDNDEDAKVKPLRIVVSEVLPVAPDVNMLVSAPKEVTVTRRPVGPDLMRLGTADGVAPILRVAGQGVLQPESLSWRLVEPATGPVLGQAVAKRSGEIPLSGDMEKSLFDLLGLRTDVPVSTDRIAGGRLEFTVRYRYHAEGYDRLISETRPLSVTLTPEATVTIPKAGGFVDELVPVRELDDLTFAALWRPGDGPLTPAEALSRIGDQRERVQAYLLAAIVGSLLFVAYLIYRLTPGRPFRPLLKWRGVSEVVIDFNSLATVPLLLGKVEIDNLGRPNPLARLLGKTAQPLLPAQLSVADTDGAKLGLMCQGTGPLVGFSSEDGLSGALDQQVSHGTLVHLFFDPARVVDARPVADPAMPIHLELHGRRIRDLEPLIIPLTLKLLPELARPPLVTFVETPGDHIFRNAADGSNTVVVGALRFSSRATRTRAESFRDRYALRVMRNQEVLPDDAFLLEGTIEGNVIVPPKGRDVTVPLLVRCDGRIVPNPDPDRDTYLVQVIGVGAPGSNLGPFPVTLCRDRTRADLALRVERGQKLPSRLITFGEDDGQAWIAVVAPDGAVKPPAQLPGNRCVLDWSATATKRKESRKPQPILTLWAENVARSGRGRIVPRFDITLVLAPSAQGALRMKPGRTIEQVLVVEGLDGEGRVSIGEGSEPTRIRVTFDDNFIAAIVGARLESGQAKLQVAMTAEGVTDTGETFTRTLRLELPLTIEELPGPNWLAIDFGTSAITAAIGDGTRSQLIPLQDVEQPGGYTLAKFDTSESGSPFFLSSVIVCDAAEQLERKDLFDVRAGFRAGFPTSANASLALGEPGFVGLPARLDDIMWKNDRIILSLKSWLGSSSPYYAFSKPIAFMDGKSRVVDNLVPLDPLVRSAFSALAEAYLQPHGVTADQVVITYPNTFTPFHQQRLKGIVCEALMERFGIALPERIRLVSESDAAACHFISERHKGGVTPSGDERLFVYDLGAGTLDISVIQVRWSAGDQRDLEGWKVLSRRGVAVAGNYLDEVLARKIDTCLKRLCDGKDLEYEFPVVANSLRQDQTRHISAIHALWRAIRAAKQGEPGALGRPPWSGTEPLRVEVYDSLVTDPSVVRIINADSVQSNVEPPASGPWFQYDVGKLYLCIPAKDIYDDPGMRDYLDFLTVTVIDEALAAARVTSNDIHTLVLSGRGALWPGLAEAVQGRFKSETGRNFKDLGGGMKGAVARGAIDWQGLARQQLDIDLTPEPSLALLMMPSGNLWTDSQWADPIPLKGNFFCQLVQIAHRDPKPLSDMKTLKKHFYVNIGPKYQQSEFATGLVHLTKKVGPGGALEITIGDGERESQTIDHTDLQAMNAVRPAWPIGQTLLQPITEE